jgi:hypothetical protein
MHNVFLELLSLTLILGACLPNFSSADNLPRIATETTLVSEGATVITPSIPVSPGPKFRATLQTPYSDQPPDGALTTAMPTFEGCMYQWANQNFPELSTEFQQAIQGLQLEAEASAYVFGEDCIHADGSKSFLARETDFNVTLQVSDLLIDAELGEWIVKVMKVIENIPQEKLVGPQPSRISIGFQTGNEQRYVNFYIDQYRALASGLSNSEIYKALQSLQ